MIRNVAREIAMHLSFELSFTDLSAEELLDARLSSAARFIRPLMPSTSAAAPAAMEASTSSEMWMQPSSSG